MRRSTLIPPKRPKYRAARAFFLVIALVTAFAIWGTLSSSIRDLAVTNIGALEKRSGSSAVSSASGRLLRKDEDIEA